jgi:hypothetical protein
MFTQQGLYKAELIELIKEEIERLKDNLCNGHGTPDFSEYRHQVGKLAGLKLALELAEVAETEASKKSRN